MALIDLHLDCKEVCTLKPQRFTKRRKAHIRASDTQHVGSLKADHRVTSLAFCVFGFFVIQ